jgi:hypothetical protein
MNIWSDDDITALLDDPEFGEAVYYYPCYGNADVFECWMEGEEQVAMFGYPFTPINLVSGVVETSQPAITIRSEDIQTLQHEDRFNVRGVLYAVTGIEPEGSGMTVIRFRNA